MKKVMLLAILVLSASVAQAKVHCSVNASSSNNNEYDQSIFTGEVNSSLILLVDLKKKSARPTNFSDLDTLPKWQAVDGQTFVTMSRQNSKDSYGISIGKVDLSKQGDALPILAMSVGSIGSKEQILALTAPETGLSIVCFEL